MIKKMVDINSVEFKKVVLGIVRKNNVFVDDIEDVRFERLPDGWVKDHELGLDWGPSSATEMNYPKAEEYCKSVGGRMPTTEELFSLVDRTVHEPAINKQAFPDTKPSWYWTSDVVVWRTDKARWVVDFGSGVVGSNGESYGFYVRPCRPSQGVVK